jgi:hypothetical protein
MHLYYLLGLEPRDDADGVPSEAVVRRRALYNLLRALLIALLALGVGLSLVLYVQASQDNLRRTQCLEAWTNAFATRYSSLLQRSNSRTDALDEFMRTLPSRDVQVEIATLRRYFKASDVYKEAAKNHPLPPVPKLFCR